MKMVGFEKKNIRMVKTIGFDNVKANVIWGWCLSINKNGHILMN